MKHFSHDFLNTLKTLPNSCVFAIIDDQNNTCLVSHSNNLGARIQSIIGSFSAHARLLILEELQDLEYKLLFCEKYKEEYKAAGYKIINGGRQYINYRVSIRYSKCRTKCLVMLYNKRRDGRVVGVFKTMGEATAFVDEFYKHGGVTFPVYANNEETRVYKL